MYPMRGLLNCQLSVSIMTNYKQCYLDWGLRLDANSIEKNSTKSDPTPIDPTNLLSIQPLKRSMQSINTCALNYLCFIFIEDRHSSSITQRFYSVAVITSGSDPSLLQERVWTVRATPVRFRVGPSLLAIIQYAWMIFCWHRG
jgi:hypothetical protein